MTDPQDLTDPDGGRAPAQPAIRRFVLTGAPGAGKTALGEALAQRGYPLVAEAATDVIADEQARGVDAAWERAEFLDRIVELQHRRLTGVRPGRHGVALFDRSPLCTLALARHLGREVTPRLAAEVARVLSERLFERDVFFVQPLGYVVRTAARRISYADALHFGRRHEEVYREHGFRLVVVEVGTVEQRADFVAAHLDALSA